ncbi:cupin domain-containing protein [Marinibaculum pumilum]|uniref:Cupin domain-containing protein n=1 Tax=Marinibaculum pumilum TaxID=1766165 RepID=A0ABV7L161_9PROT
MSNAAAKIPGDDPGTDPEEDPEIRIGRQIRHLRLVKGLRLRDMAEATGLSESLLSKIENDKSTPSLGGLHRIAKALDTNVSHFFAAAERSPGVVARAGDRVVIRTGAESSEDLSPDSEPHLMQSMIVSVDPGGESQGTRQHQGEETGYLLSGELELVIDGQSYHLRAGDSFMFRSDLPHAYRNPGNETVRVVWTNTPASL